MHTTVQQNKAHREDMFWFKSGKSEYTHCSGEVIIRKSNKDNRWYLYNGAGEQYVMSYLTKSGKARSFPLSEHSLTVAKYAVKAQIFDRDEEDSHGILTTQSV